MHTHTPLTTDDVEVDLWAVENNPKVCAAGVERAAALLMGVRL
jgi:hypothetical protein